MTATCPCAPFPAPARCRFSATDAARRTICSRVAGLPALGIGTMGRVASVGDNPAMESIFAVLQNPAERRERPAVLVVPGGPNRRDYQQNRNDLPPAPPPTRPRPHDPHRVRNRYDPSHGHHRMTPKNPVSQSLGSPSNSTGLLPSHSDTFSAQARVLQSRA